MNFTPDWESEIVDQAGLQTNCEKIDIIVQKWESFRKKTQLYWRIVFQASRNPVRKRKVSKTEIVMQSLAIKCYHEFHLSSHKDFEMLILVDPFLLLIKVIL